MNRARPQKKLSIFVAWARWYKNKKRGGLHIKHDRCWQLAAGSAVTVAGSIWKKNHFNNTLPISEIPYKGHEKYIKLEN